VRLACAAALIVASAFGWSAPAQADADARFEPNGREREDAPLARLLRIQERWRSLSPEERRYLREQVRQWRELPPEERRARREALRRYDDVPPRADRDALPPRAPQRQGLSPEERRQLRQQILQQGRRDRAPRRRRE